MSFKAHDLAISESWAAQFRNADSFSRESLYLFSFTAWIKGLLSGRKTFIFLIKPSRPLKSKYKSPVTRYLLTSYGIFEGNLTFLWAANVFGSLLMAAISNLSMNSANSEYNLMIARSKCQYFSLSFSFEVLSFNHFEMTSTESINLSAALLTEAFRPFNLE